MQKIISHQNIEKTLPYVAWSLVIAVSTVAFVVWGQTWKWHLNHLSTYQLFPIFGLLAFSIMWTHYVINTFRRGLGINRDTLSFYYSVTSYIVLLAIVLHPGLLVWQLWRDGFGLPPGSYLYHYVASNLRIVALIGTVSLFIFLAYELNRWYSTKLWWKYVEWAGDLAMVGIFYHSLEIGTQTHIYWFRVLWYFYGVTLLLFLTYKYLCLIEGRRNYKVRKS